MEIVFENGDREAAGPADDRQADDIAENALSGVADAVVVAVDVDPIRDAVGICIDAPDSEVDGAVVIRIVPR